MKKNFPQWFTSNNLINLSKKTLLSTGLFLMISLIANSQTNFYLRTDSTNPKNGTVVRPPVSNPRAWTTDPAGTMTAPGAKVPKNFTAANQIFNIQTNGYTNGKAWVISGAGSKLVVGALDSVVSFTSTGASSITATVDVLANATLLLQVANTTTISFGNLAVGSTVRYGGNNAGGYQIVLPANYYNLSLSAVGPTYLPLIFPSSPIGVAGLFTSRVSSIYGSTIMFNGTGGQVIPAGNYYNLTFSGNKSVPDTIKGTVNIAGTFSDISTGAQSLAYTVLGNGTTITSTIGYNGMNPQSVAGRIYCNLNFANGQVFPVSNFDNAANTITLYQTNPDLAVGQKISANPANGTIVLDTSSVITAISDTVITFSSAPTIRGLINHVGHATGVSPDTIYIASYSLVDSSITLSGVPANVAPGDTLKSQILTNNTIVKSVTGNIISLPTLKSLTNLNNLGNVTIGSADRKPSNKTIAGDVTIIANFNASATGSGPAVLGNITTTGTTFNYVGRRQNIAGITYNNLVINQDSATTASLQASALVQGIFYLKSGKLTTTPNRLLTLDVNATFPTVTNDTFFVNGPLAKNFATTNPFSYQIGAVNGGISYPKNVVITPKTAAPKTYTAAYIRGKVANITKINTTQLNAIADTVAYYNVALSNYTAGVDTFAKLSFQFKPNYYIDSNLVLAHYSNGQFNAESSVYLNTTGAKTTFTTNGYDTTFGLYTLGIAKTTPSVTVPTISSFTPTTASQGDTVTITGNNFIGVTSVSFGGVTASSFIVNSNTSIKAVVGNGTSGMVSVNNGTNTSSLAGFNYLGYVNVSFTVDITNYLAAGNILGVNGIRIAGNFASIGAKSMSDWLPTAATSAMTKGANNKWSITVAIPDTSKGKSLLYKFVNNDWGQNEGVDLSNSILLCGVSDGSGNYNRSLVLPNKDSSVSVCWDQCSACNLTASLPTVTTNSPSGIGATSATLSGNLKSNGGDVVKDAGIVYSTTPNSTTLTSLYHHWTYPANGVFTYTQTGLLPNTTYYIRAYAANSIGTVYGSQFSFTTLPICPTAVTNNINQSGCGSVLYNGVTYTSSTIKMDTLRTSLGCDSIYTIATIKILQPTTSITNASICAGSSYTFNGTTYTKAGSYVIHLKNALGCDSAATLNLTIKSLSTSTTNASICAGASYTFNGTTYTKAGSYVAHLTNSVGCDSAATLNLTIKALSTSITRTSICANASYTFNGTVYTTAGTYVAHLTNAVGCDSAATLILTVNALSTSTTNASICAGGSYTFNGTSYTKAGSYVAHLTNASGCDSAATLILTVNALSTSITNASICAGDSYTFNGTTYTKAGSYVSHLTNAAGCDSAATLNLTLKALSTSITRISICEKGSYTFNGTVYSLPGTYVAHLTNAVGCDSAATLVLIVNKPTSSITNQSICQSALPFTWNGNTYTSSGIYNVHLTNAAGCDSAATLKLTVNPLSRDTIKISTAVAYTWHGNTYTQSGTYTFDTLNSVGCDSLTVLILNSTLPISLKDFIATYSENKVLLNWSTATELNSSKFIVQGSTDGISFTNIGSLNAIGNGTNSYHFTDNKPSNGINYYRLQSLDKDGTSTYSKIVSVSITKDGLPITVYPNPASNSITINCAHISVVQILDNMGKVVKLLPLKDVTNPSLQVGGLTSGVYYLRVQTTDGKVNGVNFMKK